MTDTHQPIGYYLKQIDLLLTQRSNEALAEFQLSRFHWQALNTICEAQTLGQAQLFALVGAFVDQIQFDAIVAELAQRQWIAIESDEAQTLAITTAGKAAHGTVFARQSQVRARLMQGIDPDEYRATINVLARILDNLA